VPPDDTERFISAVREITSDLERARQMGARGREWVVRAASPAAVAEAYERLVTSLRRRRTAAGHR
jgi:glycosyltransferase involved in cell wall biosynthesis